MILHSRRQYLVFYLNYLRCLPHIILYYLHKSRPLILADVKRGLEEFRKSFSPLNGFIYMIAFMPSFRNVFYYRVQPYDFFLKIFCAPERSMAIVTHQIGEGLVVSHGFSTAIGAKSIGKNCTILQQVTIGATLQGEPTIKDNVVIYAGAVVFGKITIGNNVIIGANATVYTDVPDNCTVLPGTSKIMKWRKAP